MILNGLSYAIHPSSFFRAMKHVPLLGCKIKDKGIDFDDLEKLLARLDDSVDVQRIEDHGWHSPYNHEQKNEGYTCLDLLLPTHVLEYAWRVLKPHEQWRSFLGRHAVYETPKLGSASWWNHHYIDFQMFHHQKNTAFWKDVSRYPQGLSISLLMKRPEREEV